MHRIKCAEGFLYKCFEIKLILLHLYLFKLAGDFLGILRTNDEALSAENAFISDDMRLVAGKADCFDRAVANAFIAVLAI